MLTTYRLNKKISDAGFYKEGKTYTDNGYDENHKLYECYRSYDIIYDICVRYAKEFFGEKEIRTDSYECSRVWEAWQTKTMDENDFEEIISWGWSYYPEQILSMLQQSKPQDSIELFIEQNAIIFKK